MRTICAAAEPANRFAGIRLPQAKTRSLPAARPLSSEGGRPTRCIGFAPRSCEQLSVQEIQHGRLGDNRSIGAVSAGAGLLFLRPARLQIGAEMARPLDDAVVLRKPRRLETFECSLDIIFLLERL